MTASSNGSGQRLESDADLAYRVAELAADLLEAARRLGDATVIAAAELAAYRAAVALARSIRAGH